MHPAARLMFRSVLALLATVAVLALLSACGGGDCDTDDCPAITDTPTPRVDCTTRPELCR